MQKCYYYTYEFNNNLALIIKDDGKGFDADNTVAYKGNGLKNMKARAEDLDAALNINSNTNEGTIIEFKVNL